MSIRSRSGFITAVGCRRAWLKALVALGLAGRLCAQLCVDVSIDDFTEFEYPPSHSIDHPDLAPSIVNEHLVISGQMNAPAPPGNPLACFEAFFFDSASAVQVPSMAGYTTELCLDILSAKDDSSGTADDVFTTVLLWGPGPTSYMAMKDRDEIGLLKERGPNPPVLLFWEERAIPNDNVTLVVSATRVGDSVRATVKVEDLAANGKVLYQRSFLDGPGVDADVPEVPPLGWSWWAPDPGPPVDPATRISFGIAHATQAEHPPRIEVVLDNLRYRLIPNLEADKAVRLSWPDPQRECALESAPTLDGPWSEVTTAAETIQGDRREFWVLTDQDALFYRLRAASR